MTDEINITPEETAKIAGILETKWTQTYSDMTKWKAEAESKATELDVMTADRNYWRKRAEDSERERDEARESEEYMHRQWQGVVAIGQETVRRRGMYPFPPPKELTGAPQNPAQLKIVKQTAAENAARDTAS